MGRVSVQATVGTRDSGDPLIGYIPLEQAQAVVDLAGHRLAKVDHVDLKRYSRS